jgi:hypothetical protein
MDKTKAVIAPKKQNLISFAPTEKARANLDKLAQKGYSKRAIICGLLEKININHYKKLI